MNCTSYSVRSLKIQIITISKALCMNEHTRLHTIDIHKVDKQLTHAMHVKDRHVNDTFIDKFTKWYQ